MKKRLLFVINPKSGTQKKQQIPQLIQKYLAQSFEVEISFTQYAQHATEIAQKAVAENIDVVVAVGGDGTVNEIAKALLHSQTALYILPMGSGNGLARHLGIPMNIQEAIQKIPSTKNTIIDTCFVNEKAFFCTSGMGFDAHIAYNFSLQKSRGLINYAKTAVKAFWEYKPQIYEINNQKIEALMLTIANAAQFGNDAFIAPKANISDGFMDICITKPLNFWTSLRFNKDLFSKNLDKNPQYEFFKAKEVIIKREKVDFIHFDGEPYEMPADLHYKIVPQSLRVWQ